MTIEWKIEEEEADGPEEDLWCPECENIARRLFRLKGDTGGVCGECFMQRHSPEMRVMLEEVPIYLRRTKKQPTITKVSKKR